MPEHPRRLSAQGDPPRLLAAGNGVDEVVKQDGQWLFKSRQVTAPNDD